MNSFNFFGGLTSEVMFHFSPAQFAALPTRWSRSGWGSRTRPRCVPGPTWLWCLWCLMLAWWFVWFCLGIIYTTCYHIIYIYIYIIHSNNDNNDDHIMMVINNNNNKLIYIYIHLNILEIIIVLGILFLTNQWTVEWQRGPLSQAQAGQLAMVDHAASCSPSLLPSCWSSPSSCTGCLIPWLDAWWVGTPVSLPINTMSWLSWSYLFGW